MLTHRRAEVEHQLRDQLRPIMNDKLICRAHISDYWLLQHALFMHGQPVSINMLSYRDTKKTQGVDDGISSSSTSNSSSSHSSSSSSSNSIVLAVVVS